MFERFRAAGSPGCAVALTRAGITLVTGTHGLANIDRNMPIAPDTVFEAGSVSKQFTAAAMLLLVQQGKASLGDDIHKYLPELPRYGQRITIAHLLSHTSGLRDWGTVLEAAGRPRGSQFYAPEDVLAIVARQRSLNFTPGSQHLYNNTGYSLLPVIIERITGASFSEFTARQIFEPLGMRHTTWRDDVDPVAAGRAIAYAAASDGSAGFVPDMPMESVLGHAGLLTTVGDLSVWNEALDTGRIGGRNLAIELERPTRLTSGRTIAYARGVVVAKYGQAREISHTGSTAGYRSFLARYPEQRLSVALLCNAATINTSQLGRQVASAFLPPAPPEEASPVPPKLNAEVLARRAGLFRNSRTNEPLTLTAADGALRSGAGEVLIPLSDSAFRFEGSLRRIEFSSASGHETVNLFTDENEAVELQRMTAVTLTPEQMAAYAGDYVSDEADASYTASINDGSLVLTPSSGAPIGLTASYADTFTTSSGWVVRFVRDGLGRVSAMSLGLPRVRDLRFRRVNGAASQPQTVRRY